MWTEFAFSFLEYNNYITLRSTTGYIYVCVYIELGIWPEDKKQ
jgi:hypothetical protein